MKKLKQDYIEYLRVNKLCQEALTFNEWLNKSEE